MTHGNDTKDTGASTFGMAPPPIFKELGAKWGWMMASGLLTILFGVLAFEMPLTAVYAMTLLFGAYAMVDGVLSIIFAVRQGPHGDGHFWPLLVRGALGIFAGIIVLMMPILSTISLVTLAWIMLAIWSIATGGLELAAAMRLRHEIKGEWILGLSGLVSLVFGLAIPILLWNNPAAGIVTMAWMIGFYAILHGVLEVWLSLGLRKLARG